MNDLAQYEKIRPQLKSGDVIVFQGNDFGAKIIRRETKSEYSHIGLVIRLTSNDYDRVLLLESIIDPGVILWPLSNKLQKYSGKAWWCGLNFDIKRIHLPGEKLRNAKREAIVTWGMNEIGKKYDFKEIGSIARKMLWKTKQRSREDYQQYICSELVCAVLKSQGLLPIGSTSENMTPQDVVGLDILNKPVNLV